MGSATRIIGVGLLVLGGMLPFGLRFVQDVPWWLYLLPAALLVIADGNYRPAEPRQPI